MEVLFVHPNFPGQFLRMAQAFAAQPGLKVYGIGDDAWSRAAPDMPGLTMLRYPAPVAPENRDNLHIFSRGFDDAIRRGEQILATLAEHKAQGLEPDIIFIHPGWGDALFLRDIFPGAHIVSFFEFYYRSRGADLEFDHEFPPRMADMFRVRSMNATQLLALESCDVGITPTYWQRSRYPEAWHDRLQVIHEGIDTERVVPNPQASLQLPNGHVLRAGDEVLTFASRNLEPYRGLHVFLRALPTIMAQRPNCQVVIAGGTEKGYGRSPPEGTTFWQYFLDEVKGRLDMDRVHYLGPQPYEQFLVMLQVSRLHVYLTYPFVLSWSMLEAMSAGCLVLGSATAPVEEVIEDGVNGLLTPFHSPGALADRAILALGHPDHFAALRAAARQTIIDRYDFATVSLPAYRRLLDF